MAKQKHSKNKPLLELQNEFDRKLAQAKALSEIMWAASKFEEMNVIDDKNSSISGLLDDLLDSMDSINQKTWKAAQIKGEINNVR